MVPKNGEGRLHLPDFSSIAPALLLGEPYHYPDGSISEVSLAKIGHLWEDREACGGACRV